jgi:N6-adenosine-specific RNA methylase IME4/ParB-like chromosome segregation protein Spo0J
MRPSTRGTRATPDPAAVTLPITDIVIGPRHRKHLGDIEGFAARIKAVGLLHPVVVTPDRDLVAGERRILACSLLGWTEIPVRIIDPPDLLRAEADENTERQDFTPSEAVAIAAALRPIEEAAAKERQGARTDLAEPSAKLAEGEKPKPSKKSGGESRKKVAAAVGMSATTLAKAEAVVAAAEMDPELSYLVTEMDSMGGKVNTAYKRLQKKRVLDRIDAEPVPLPSGPFRVIAADPPWPYESRADDGTHRAAVPYPTMTLDAIRALPVAGLAHDDAVLWLWTTNAFMEHAFGVAREWGFEPKTILTWAKDKMGVGDWLRGQTEHCLMAVRGHPTITLTTQTTLLHGPVREHSRKPDEFFALVENLCPGSKVELFAREARDGWTRWGAEAPKGAAA